MIFIVDSTTYIRVKCQVSLLEVNQSNPPHVQLASVYVSGANSLAHSSVVFLLVRCKKHVEWSFSRLLFKHWLVIMMFCNRFTMSNSSHKGLFSTDFIYWWAGRYWSRSQQGNHSIQDVSIRRSSSVVQNLRGMRLMYRATIGRKVETYVWWYIKMRVM